MKLARYRSLLFLLAGLPFAPLLQADPIKSLLPVFGDDGEEFSTKTQQGNLVHGWLPAGWVDNSEWAPISAAYSKLDDRPDDALGAVRIKCEKIDDGQLQVTSWAGERTYLRGKRYRVVGWLRSAEPRRLTVSIRQLAEPYETYQEGEVATGTDWKPFEFDFAPEMDRKAIVVLALGEPGTVDLAGVSVAEGGPPASLLPPMGTEGETFSHPAEKGHVIRGWLPSGWDDNSEWAPLNATYSRPEDFPADVFGGVRIRLEEIADGQLQLTSYSGETTYAQGKAYKVAGWARSPDKLRVGIHVRQAEEPFEVYHEGEITTGPAWKPFEYTFRPSKDTKALIMFIVKEAGSVDLSGVSVAEQR